MGTDPYFKLVRKWQHSDSSADPPNHDFLVKLLTECVVKPFERVMHTTAVIVPLNGARPDGDEEPQPNPCHPACAQYACSDYCRESWQLHLVEVSRHSNAHWHTCDFGMFCGLVPVTCQGHCLAAVRLASPTSISEETFDQHVAFLDILVENFVTKHTHFLGQLVCHQQSSCEVGTSPSGDNNRPIPQVAEHPQVEQALNFIDARLSDSGLTVACVARHVGVPTNRLCRLFATQVGWRMSRYIVDKRIEQAKLQLATTDHQIKRIAYNTGHAHPNWFSHLFTQHTGMTPRQYRIQNQGRLILADELQVDSVVVSF